MNAPTSSPAVLFERLDAAGLAYVRVDHVAVFTIEEALLATPSLPGIKDARS